MHQLLHQSKVLHLIEPMSATVLQNLFWLKLQEVSVCLSACLFEPMSLAICLLIVLPILTYQTARH